MLKARVPASKAAENPNAIAKGLVSRLYDDILQEGCAVFLGAGSTTEREMRGSKSFYEHIRAISRFPAASPSPSFPDLMQYFCEHVDGGRHNRLIREALSRVESFCVPGEDNNLATIFTDSLAEIPYLNRFVTTNWDPFLERSLDVLVPTVEDRDLAFWDDRKRQVLKIHGCITRPYSLVATQEDYEKCTRQNPLIFNKLKDLMATKTFLFAGYSMRDADFQKVWDGTINSLGRFAKLAYALDPNATPDRISFWKERGIELFKVTDVMFVRTLRQRLEKEQLIPSERFLEFLKRQRRRIASIHVNLNQTSVGRLASAMYQDGLLHALEDVLTATTLGTKKKEDFEVDLRESEKRLAQFQRKHNPIEIAYWSGRFEVIRRFINRTKVAIPPYFHPYRGRPLAKLVNGRKFPIFAPAGSGRQ
jgi:hypothetical protein